MSEAVALAPPPAGAGRGRKENTRGRLLAAARARFCEEGYVGVSVEDIAAAAGVTRMTFYRYFSGKTAVAIELYRLAEQAALPRLLAVRERDFADAGAVRSWLCELFEADRGERRLLRAFKEAAAVEPRFTGRAQEMIAVMIAGLGSAIPAFAVGVDIPAERRRWLQAWLLVYEILDQSHHAATSSGVADDPLVVDLLCERFLAFVVGARRGPEPPLRGSTAA